MSAGAAAMWPGAPEPPAPRRPRPSEAAIRAMLVSRRCGARTRAGPACRAPAVKGRSRCRKHGGAEGSGAPAGNRNALKTGLFTAAAIADRRKLRQLMWAARRLLEEI